MSNIDFFAYGIIHATKTIKGVERTDSFNFRVDSFEVDGGADRKIDLSSAIEFNIGSEFEQARTYKNIILYIRHDEQIPKLIELAKSDKKDFDFIFSVDVYGLVGKTGKLRDIEMSASGTNFAGTPIPVGKTPPLLKAKFVMNSIKLYAGQLDEKRKVIISERI